MADEDAAILDYHTPQPSSGIANWLRKLPRPTWATCIALLLTAAAAYWLHADSAPWKVVRTFDGAMTWHGLSADGKQLLTVPANTQTIRIFDIATGKIIRDLHRPTGIVRTAAFSPDGKRVWSIGAGGNDVAYLWDVSSGQLLVSHASKLPPFGFDWLGVNYASPFSPDGRWIAAGQYGELVIFDGHTGAVVKKLPEAYFSVFSPDSRYLAALYSPPRQVRIWDTQTWRQIAAFPVGSGDGLVGDDGRRIAFSPDSKTLIAGFEHQVKQWTAATNQVAPFITTSQTVWDCGFSPDGLHIVTAEQETDDLCECWDAATGKMVSSMRPGGFPCYPSISPDGSRAVCHDMILDFPTLTPLTHCSPFWITGNPHAWLPAREAFVAGYAFGMPLTPPITRLFERRRPEAGYGLLWLPQTWVALLGVFITSWLIRRDLQRWRRNPVLR